MWRYFLIKVLRPITTRLRVAVGVCLTGVVPVLYNEAQFSIFV